MLFSYLRKTSLMVFTLFSLASCGNPERNLLKQVKVQSYYDNADVIVKVNAMLNLGRISVPSVTLPIFYPTMSDSIGKINLVPTLSGLNEIEIELNVSAVSTLSAQSQTLPNGAILPLIGSNKVIKVPIDRVATLYITLEQGAMAVGAAINIATFDQIGAKVGTTAFFPVFNLQGVIASAGLYTSKNSGQNGMGVFVDISSALDLVARNDLLAGRASSATQLNFSQLTPSSSSKSKIDASLGQLHEKAAKLKLFR
jgi:hypothetical protein